MSEYEDNPATLYAIAAIRADERGRVLDELEPFIFNTTNLGSVESIDALEAKIRELREEN